jgi:7-cyano-7-deazaguanine synthase
LAWALEKYDRVETIGFDYGQRHRIELSARLRVLESLKTQFPKWAARLGDDHVVDLATLGQISDTALTRDTKIRMEAANLPNTFVPGRNLMFFTLASAVGYRRNLNVVVGGMCETDFSGYPDCRDDTIKAQQVAVSLGMGQRFTYETPLMWIDKAQTWQLAKELGGEDLVSILVNDSHTCYLGIRESLHDWGYGCGTCPACDLRSKGYERWRTGEQHHE